MKFKYRICRVDTEYGIMHLVEVKRLFMWFELCCVCSRQDAEIEINKHARPKAIPYDFYDDRGKQCLSV